MVKSVDWGGGHTYRSLWRLPSTEEDLDRDEAASQKPERAMSSRVHETHLCFRRSTKMIQLLFIESQATRVSVRV